MDKKIIGIILGVLLIAVLGGVGYLLVNNKLQNDDINNSSKDNGNNASQTDESKNQNNDSNISSNSKNLVVYFSAQSHTKSVAEKISQYLNADTFEIVPKNKYTEDDLDWTDTNSGVTKEHEDESLRDVELVSTKPNNWDSYDTVLIGYPIWWGIAAWPVDTFIKSNDFDGKTVIPFCTSASSGLGESGKLLENLAKGGSWKEGKRFSSNPSDADIKSWSDTIK